MIINYTWFWHSSTRPKFNKIRYWWPLLCDNWRCILAGTHNVSAVVKTSWRYLFVVSWKWRLQHRRDEPQRCFSILTNITRYRNVVFCRARFNQFKESKILLNMTFTIEDITHESIQPSRIQIIFTLGKKLIRHVPLIGLFIAVAIIMTMYLISFINKI